MLITSVFYIRQSEQGGSNKASVWGTVISIQVYKVFKVCHTVQYMADKPSIRTSYVLACQKPDITDRATSPVHRLEVMFCTCAQPKVEKVQRQEAQHVQEERAFSHVVPTACPFIFTTLS